MSDAGLTDADLELAEAAEVKRVVAEALQAAGLNPNSPSIRRAVVDAITNRPLDRKLTTAQRTEFSLQLRLAGASYREIARLVGYAGPGPAQKAVMRAISALTQEPAEQLRIVALQRLEQILAGGLYRKAVAGEFAAIDRVITIMREQRRYVPGLEVPTNAEITGGGGGAIIIELNIPAPVPVAPIPQGQLAGLAAGMPPVPVLELDDDDHEEVLDDDDR